MRQVGHEIDSVKAISKQDSEEDDRDDLYLLLEEGLPLLHSQATYTKALELEVKELVAKIGYFASIEDKYKSEMEELTTKFEEVVQFTSYSSHLKSDKGTYSD